MCGLFSEYFHLGDDDRDTSRLLNTVQPDQNSGHHLLSRNKQIIFIFVTKEKLPIGVYEIVVVYELSVAVI